MTRDRGTRDGTDEERTTDEGGQATGRRRVLLATATLASTGLAGCPAGSILGGDGGDGDGGDGDGDADTGGGGGATVTTTASGPETVTAREPPTPASCEPETVTENIEEDTTWSPEDCQRVAIEGNIDVSDGATLTVEAGVEVVARSNAKITVRSQGTLAVQGADDDPVWFYGETMAPAFWRGIDVRSQNENVLSNAVVRDAGAEEWAGIWVNDDAQLSITDSGFANSETYGLVLGSGATLTEFARNTFVDNGTAAAWIGTEHIGMFDSASQYAGGNENDRIEVSGSEIESETTWPQTDAPFYLTGNHNVRASVSVDPGAQFTFANNAKITVRSNGSFAATGESGNPVVFMGDTETPGFWRGIDVRSNNPNNTLDHVEVAHGGLEEWANVWVNDDARLTVRNSTFRDSATHGLVVGSGAVLEEFSNNEFAANETAAAWIGTEHIGMFDSASQYAGGNENDRIEVSGSEIESETTWPATDAPFYLMGNHNVRAAVSVDPGAQFTFAENAKITVRSNGSFAAEAGDGDTITFLGATGDPGFWRAIDVRSNNPNNVFDNVEVAHGGAEDWANLWINDDAQATVRNSTFRDSATYGLVVANGATFEGSNNTYENNAEGGIRNDNE